jgi:hypothetical protein
MYCHRVAGEDLWDVLMRARETMLQRHPLYLELRKKFQVEPGKIAEAMQLLDELTDEYRGFTMEIQLFPDGDNWLLRGLEHGWQLRNWLSEQPSCANVIYDNRTDVSPEEEANAEVARWMDEQIMGGQFLVFNVLSRNDFEQVIFKQLYQPKRSDEPSR